MRVGLLGKMNDEVSTWDGNHLWFWVSLVDQVFRKRLHPNGLEVKGRSYQTFRIGWQLMSVFNRSSS